MIFRRHHEEQEIRSVMERTGLSRDAVVAGIKLAVELAKNTTLSPRATWSIMRKFFDAFVSGYKLRMSTGYDPTDDLINFVVTKSCDHSYGRDGKCEKCDGGAPWATEKPGKVSDRE